MDINTAVHTLAGDVKLRHPAHTVHVGYPCLICEALSVVDGKHVSETKSKSRRHPNRYQRVLWLKDHRNVWALPLRTIFEQMQTDGLFAKSTYWKDAVNGIKEIIEDIEGGKL